MIAQMAAIFSAAARRSDFSMSATNSSRLPFALQPKQWKICFCGLTLKLGVFSL